MLKKKIIRIITLGCSKNLVDSEKLLGQLPADRFVLYHEGSGEADIVIINTCGFINDAKQESIDIILEFAAARKNGVLEKLMVMGCLSARYLDELQQEIPEVDAWFGVGAPVELLNYLEMPHRPNCQGRVLKNPSHYAYLKIAEGCDRSCSFCAIPMIRGPYISRPVDELVEEARGLAMGGVKELILVAQDLSYYGYDLKNRRMLSTLLESLSAVEGIGWIRLQYAYPNLFPMEVLHLMASDPKICNYLDVPLQHINDDILRSMRRGHDRASTIKFLHKAREMVPGLALRTTLMVGYPGETEAAFQELMSFTEETRFDRLGVFTYSAEEGTPAYPLGDPVPEEVKEARAEEIMQLQSEISQKINRDKIGQTMQVIIDRQEGDVLIGRTASDSPEVDNEVIIKPALGLSVGQFTRVCITDATAYDLFAGVDPATYFSL